MKDIEFKSLEISGYSELAVPNSFLRQKEHTNTLAVFLPGLHYTCDKLLLYYSAGILLEAGADVLQLKTDYTRREFQFASQADRMRWLLSDSQSAVKPGLEQRDYDCLVLVGKSIGTLAMAGLVSIEINIKMAAIWLTPLLNQPVLVDAAIGFDGAALFVAGSSDAVYLPDALRQIQGATSAAAFIVEDADHSLEIPGDPLASIKIMGQVMDAVGEFLEEEGIIV